MLILNVMFQIARPLWLTLSYVIVRFLIIYDDNLDEFELKYPIGEVTVKISTGRFDAK